MCRVPQPDGDEQWYSFNDENVVRVSPSQVRVCGMASCVHGWRAAGHISTH